MAQAVMLSAASDRRDCHLDAPPTPAPLPPKPQPPVDYDCCGGGCADCELKIYLRELGRWQKQARQLGMLLDD